MYRMLAFGRGKYIAARYGVVKYENFEFNNLIYIHLKVYTIEIIRSLYSK